MPKPLCLRQVRIPGQRRKSVNSSIEKAIEKKIQQEMDRYPGVTRSFVIANALAFVFSIEIRSYK